MLAQEVIRRKRDGHTLSTGEIGAFVVGVTTGSWSESQVAAMAMAMFLKGMSDREKVDLTQAMTHSGSVMDWSDAKLDGPILDKHSTGGVGDKVSLMLAPIIAACGAYVPMISGRGLGHTGGTLDKFDSIPGYQTAPDTTRLRQALQSAGCAIIGQTAELAPADRRLYAIRDVTATVESVALITASILSKKLAAGLQGLVMDVKVGNGAFADTPAMASELAQSLVAVANGAGLPTRAWITDMNQVLGHTVGNALEMREAVDFLKNGHGEPRLQEVTLTLCAELLQLGGLAGSATDALRQIDKVLHSGKALDHFARMVHALGGPSDFCDHPARYLAAAPVQHRVLAPKAGWVSHMATRDIGLALIGLGGGRRITSDTVDSRVGFSNFVQVGQYLGQGSVLAVVHAASTEAAQACADQLFGLIQLAEEKPALKPALLQRIAN